MLLSRLTTAARLRAPLVRFSSSSAVSTTVRPLSQVSWLTDSAKIQIAQAEAKQAADASRQKTTDTSFKTPFAPVLFESTDSNRIPNTRGKYREQVCRTPIIPISTKKLNLVAQLLSGMEVERAMLQLMFMPLGHTKEILWAIKEGCSIAEKIQKVDPRQFYICTSFSGNCFSELMIPYSVCICVSWAITEGY